MINREKKNRITFTKPSEMKTEAILDMKIEAIKHQNIKGEESYHLKITDINGAIVFIRVGKKNYEAVKNMKQATNSLT